MHFKSMRHPKDSSTRQEPAQVIGSPKLFKEISRSYTQTRFDRGEHLEKKHYHLIGICGTAMASLAGMLAEQGHKVSGSDENVYPPMSLELERLGIPVREGYKPDNLVERPAVVVVGNATDFSGQGIIHTDPIVETFETQRRGIAALRDRYV